MRFESCGKTTWLASIEASRMAKGARPQSCATLRDQGQHRF
jgi:hypothetical protein